MAVLTEVWVTSDSEYFLVHISRSTTSCSRIEQVIILRATLLLFEQEAKTQTRLTKSTHKSMLANLMNAHDHAPCDLN